MQISISELAAMLGGTVEGDGSLLLHTASKIEEGSLGSVSFLSNPKYEEQLYHTLSSAVLVSKTFQPTKGFNTTLIRVDDPYASFSYLLEKFSDPAVELIGIDANTQIDESAELGSGIYVGAFTYISKNVKIGNNTKIFPNVFIGADVKIGNNCSIHPGVNIYHECVIGDNCVILAGTVIGSDGFGYAPLPDRSYKKIPQIGNVILEDDVEIGANTCIDRATMGSTIIRKGAKIDNLVQIAHNAEIGEHTVIAGQTGIAGSAKLGKYIVIGGQVAVAGHLHIADGNQFGGQSGVQGHIKEENKKWFGSPVMELRDSMRAGAVYRRLPDMLSRIEALEKEIKKLKSE